MIPAEFFQRDPIVCARELINCELVWGNCAGLIVETEAYCAEGDPACHTFARKSARVFVDNHQAGDAYIYLNYGLHWLFNVLVKGSRNGFVLIRALKPTLGMDEMRERRRLDEIQRLCSGPGKLAQALGITGKDHGRSMCQDQTYCLRGDGSAAGVTSDVRVGISRAVELPWRFLLTGSEFISVPPTDMAAKHKKTRLL